MRELLILRHAKSSWDNERIDDHDRPLNERGIATAPRMGRLIRDEGIAPDAIFSSTAERAASTATAVAVAAGLEITPTLLPELYLAEPSTYFDVLRRRGGAARRAMVVGHNPTLEMLAGTFAGRAVRFPTASLAHVRLALDDWADLDDETAGELLALWRPKELPPERATR